MQTVVVQIESLESARLPLNYFGSVKGPAQGVVAEIQLDQGIHVVHTIRYGTGKDVKGKIHNLELV